MAFFEVVVALGRVKAVRLRVNEPIQFVCVVNTIDLTQRLLKDFDIRSRKRGIDGADGCLDIVNERRIEVDGIESSFDDSNGSCRDLRRGILRLHGKLHLRRRIHAKGL